jgi:hypothetical protein
VGFSVPECLLVSGGGELEFVVELYGSPGSVCFVPKVGG